MHGIAPKRNKNTLARWLFGSLFLLLSVTSISSSFIAALFFLLAGIISIPLTAAQLERKSNLSMSGTVRFFVVFLLFMGASAALPDDTPSVDNSEAAATTSIETPTPTKIETPETDETPAEVETPKQVSPPEEKPTKEELSDEYKSKLKEQEADETPEADETSENEEASEADETSESEDTSMSGTTMQLSESKKAELIGYVKDYSGSDEVEVLYISPKDSSSTGTMMVTYYLDAAPSTDKLESDLTNIVIISRQIAEESGITNPEVNVAAMLGYETGLGTGNYYSSTGKTDIFIQPPEN